MYSDGGGICQLELREGQRRPVIAKLRPEGHVENKPAEAGKVFQAQEGRGGPVLRESGPLEDPRV